GAGVEPGDLSQENFLCRNFHTGWNASSLLMPDLRWFFNFSRTVLGGPAGGAPDRPSMRGREEKSIFASRMQFRFLEKCWKFALRNESFSPMALPPVHLSLRVLHA